MKISHEGEETAHHLETSARKEKQVRKRETDRERSDAPPQSLAFSCKNKYHSDVIYHHFNKAVCRKLIDEYIDS